MSLPDELKGVLGEVLGADSSAIPDNASSQTLAGWDSQKHLLLILTLEERYGISFSTDEIVEVQSLPALIRVVGEYVGEAES
jgi:acyl carrier protein